jgi:metal binding Ada-like protein
VSGANYLTRRRLLVLALCFAGVAAACRGRFAHAVGPDQGRLVASRTGERYHRPECNLARRIASKHLLYYRTGDDAYADGFTPCQVCRP